jgi:hypothetical protein
MENSIQSWYRRFVFLRLLGHLVCPRQHIRWNCQADLFGGYQDNHELKLRGLFYWQVGRLGAFENFVYQFGSNIRKSILLPCCATRSSPMRR